MKGWYLALALLFVATSAQANPYFRPNNLFDHPISVQGALLAPDLKDSEGAVLYPIFTHSPKDGQILPFGEDWSPIAIGGALNAGKITFAQRKEIFSQFMNKLSSPDKLMNIRGALKIEEIVKRLRNNNKDNIAEIVGDFFSQAIA